MKKTISIFGGQINLVWFILLVLLAFSLVGGCTYRVNWLTSVKNFELAYRWNRLDGSITPVAHNGWCKVKPFVTKIYTIDSRPMQIRIEANLPSGSNSNGGVNTRVLNAKLVQFDPKGAEQFFTYHGLADYDQGSLSEILKIYAYEGAATKNYNSDSLQAKYKFLKILGETSGIETSFTGSESKIDTTHEN